MCWNLSRAETESDASVFVSMDPRTFDRTLGWTVTLQTSEEALHAGRNSTSVDLLKG